MTVVVNGDATVVAEGATVADLLRQLGLDRRWVVVERNREPVARGAMAATPLADDDRIELVRAVAGGWGRVGLGALELPPVGSGRGQPRGPTPVPLHRRPA